MNKQDEEKALKIAEELSEGHEFKCDSLDIYKGAMRTLNNYTKDEYGCIRVRPEDIFPELKESEDKKIRKELIQYLKDYPNLPNGHYCRDDFFSWLKRQGEPQDKGKTSDGYHTFNELYYYRMLYNAAFFNLLPKEWVHKSKRHHTGEECFGGGWFIVLANLPTGQISNHYELKYWDLFTIPEKEFADKWNGHTPQEAAESLRMYLLEKQDEQNPIDKVESKFNVSDWIINNDKRIAVPEQILKIKEHGYVTSMGYISFDKVKTDYHLWTIKDANDGDILYSHNSNLLWIYKDKITYHASMILDYAQYNCISTNCDIVIPLDACPATKKQCDLLFQKMKEAGYEYDDEEKKLKKIKQNSAWSKEDEEFFDEIIKGLKTRDGKDTNSSNWFKLLKDRVQPQPKQEWSEEDEKKIEMINNVIDFASNQNLPRRIINNGDKYTLKYWLKSLKPNHWKPSEVQLETLWNAICYVEDDINSNFVGGCMLESLYKDLKNL